MCSTKFVTIYALFSANFVAQSFLHFACLDLPIWQGGACPTGQMGLTQMVSLALPTGNVISKSQAKLARFPQKLFKELYVYFVFQSVLIIFSFKFEI